MTNIMVEATDSQKQLLCCRYLVVLIEALHVRVSEEDGSQLDAPVRWALGVLADGQYEVLGVWPGAMPGEANGSDLFQELMFRGVERIHCVAGDGLHSMCEPLRLAYPAAVVAQAMGPLLRRDLTEVAPRDRGAVFDVLDAVRSASTAREARAALAELATSSWGTRYAPLVERWGRASEGLGTLYALAPRVRRMILKGDSMAQLLHERCSRAVDRHGCFATRAAAISFASEALSRAERDFRGWNVACEADLRAPCTVNGPKIEAVGL